MMEKIRVNIQNIGKRRRGIALIIVTIIALVFVSSSNQSLIFLRIKGQFGGKNQEGQFMKADLGNLHILAEKPVKGRPSPISPDGDYDHDGLTNREETDLGTNPMLSDTDGDGLLDGPEVYYYCTNPICWDTDGDQLSDSEEIFIFRTDPNNKDSDGDGLLDGYEVQHGHDPKKWDNWRKLSLTYVTPGIVSILLLVFVTVFFVGVAPSLQSRFLSGLEKQLQNERNIRHLSELLCSLPPNLELNIKEMAEMADCSEEYILQLIESLFDSSEFDEMAICIHSKDIIIFTTKMDLMETLLPAWKRSLCNNLI